MSPATSLAKIGSSPPVGSSNSKSSGWKANVRATATRCRSPPLRRSSRPGIGTPSSRSISCASSRPPRVAANRWSMAKRTLSTAVSSSKSARFWKTSPIDGSSLSSFCSHPIVTSPLIRMAPFSESTNPAICRSKVVFPDPLGPINKTNSPGSIFKLAPSRRRRPLGRMIVRFSAYRPTRLSDDVLMTRVPACRLELGHSTVTARRRARGFRA